MAWTAEELFDALSDGDLNGQGGGSGWSANWSGGANYDIQGTDTFKGSTKAVTGVNANQNISRTLTTAVTDGVVYVAMKTTSMGGDAQFDFVKEVGVANCFRLSFRDDGGTPKAALVGDALTYVFSPLSLTTWYYWKVTFNGTTVDAELFDEAGVSQGATTGKAYQTAGDVAAVQINSGNAQTILVDYISPTDPNPPVVGGNLNRGFNLLGVGQ